MERRDENGNFRKDTEPAGLSDRWRLEIGTTSAVVLRCPAPRLQPPWGAYASWGSVALARREIADLASRSRAQADRCTRQAEDFDAILRRLEEGAGQADETEVRTARTLALRAMLGRVMEAPPPESVVAAWSEQQRSEAKAWSAGVLLSDGDHCEPGRPMPTFLAGYR